MGVPPTPLPWNLTLKIRRKQRRERPLTISFKIETAFRVTDVILILAQVYNKFYQQWKVRLWKNSLKSLKQRLPVLLKGNWTLLSSDHICSCVSKENSLLVKRTMIFAKLHLHEVIITTSVKSIIETLFRLSASFFDFSLLLLLSLSSLSSSSLLLLC